MKDKIIDINLKIYGILTLVCVVILSMQYIYATNLSYIVQAIIFGFYYYFKYTWYFVIWIFLQNFMMHKFKVDKLFILVMLGIMFIDPVAYIAWDDGYANDKLYPYLIIEVLLISILTIVIFKLTKPYVWSPINNNTSSKG